MSNCLDVVLCNFFVIVISIVVQVSSQALQTGNGIGLPDFIDYQGVANDNRLPRHTQGIIYTYSFNSCGNVTEWGADLHQDRRYSLDFQVWRPSPTVDDSTGTGCYSLVGNNRFTSISLIGGVARVTPSPQDYIQFQPNDVLGFYIESASIRPSNSLSNGLVLQTSPSRLTSELVWYASIAPSVATSQSGSCPYSVGTSGVLDISTRAAPVISIATTTFPCPSQSSSSQRSSTSSSSVKSRHTQSSVPSHQTSHPENISPTRTRPTALASIGPITPHQTTTDEGSGSSTSPAQVPWLLVGSVTTAVAMAIVFVVLLAVIVSICCLKRTRGKKKEVDQRRQSVISDAEHDYDYVHTFGGTAQTPCFDYSKVHVGGGDCHPNQGVETLKRNEAYDMVNRRSMDIEASHNIAYHVVH